MPETLVEEIEAAEREVRGKRVSIIGAARSGVAAASLLISQGAEVFVSDKETKEKLEDSVKRLESLSVSYEVGGHSARALEADLIVVSPGVPSDAPVLREASARGIRVVSE